MTPPSFPLSSWYAQHPYILPDITLISYTIPADGLHKLRLHNGPATAPCCVASEGSRRSHLHGQAVAAMLQDFLRFTPS